jgi:hypothetical protein
MNPQRPRVELIQPRLKESIVEVIVGPKADAGTIKRVRDGLAARGLTHVPVTKNKAEQPGDTSKEDEVARYRVSS